MEKANIEPGDSRVSLIERIGGPDLWNLLEKMAEKDDHLRAVMASVNEKTDKKPKKGIGKKSK